MAKAFSRRSFVAAGAQAAVIVAGAQPVAAQTRLASGDGLEVLDPIRTELVMNIVVTCSKPETFGPGSASKDGERTDFWPIIGGKFQGKGIRGVVIPGGADFPLKRPDGVDVIDALYRLRTDDGVTIIIHNRGLVYPGKGEWPPFRLMPEFTAPVGRYDWLNKSVFVATLVPVPPKMALAKGPDQNDRLIQVHRIY